MSEQAQAEGHGLQFHLRVLDDALSQRFAANSAGMQAYARDWRRSEMAQVPAEIKAHIPLAWYALYGDQ
eukprot:230253-Rhodomonas_salina.1